jgi:hypothetical protein
MHLQEDGLNASDAAFQNVKKRNWQNIECNSMVIPLEIGDA